jgi:hypothetical protein
MNFRQTGYDFSPAATLPLGKKPIRSAAAVDRKRSLDARSNFEPALNMQLKLKARQ